LVAASRDGGGIVYFPAGTYRVQGWFVIPHQVILRGERRDVTWLKWPEVEARSPTDFSPAVLFSSGKFAIEHLSLMARNTQTILRDLSWDSASGKPPAPELQRQMPPWVRSTTSFYAMWISSFCTTQDVRQGPRKIRAGF
jgi:hypothetical protein